jgi:hypothetical protein
MVTLVQTPQRFSREMRCIGNGRVTGRDEDGREVPDGTMSSRRIDLLEVWSQSQFIFDRQQPVAAGDEYRV